MSASAQGNKVYHESVIMTRSEQQWMWMWTKMQGAFFQAMNASAAAFAVDENSSEAMLSFDMMYCGGGPL